MSTDAGYRVPNYRDDRHEPATVPFKGGVVSVPSPIYLRTACHPTETRGTGKISIKLDQGNTVFVNTPAPCDDVQRPHGSDTVLYGTIEITMKEGRQVQAISVGIQSVSRLYMGSKRFWEEDGLFERGVQIIGGDQKEVGVWLAKGSTSSSDSNPRLDGLFLQQVVEAEKVSVAGKETSWLEGDIVASQSISIRSSAYRCESRTSLDLVRQHHEDGMGIIQVALSSDCFAIGGAVVIELNCPSPSPRTVIVSATGYIAQQYFLLAPRQPTDSFTPEGVSLVKLFEEGACTRGKKLHHSDLDSNSPLFTGNELSDSTETKGDWSWRTTFRMPDHSKLSPTTPKGMVTPIRVLHNFVLSIVYGEVDQNGVFHKHFSEISMNLEVPDCMAHTRSMFLPTYQDSMVPSSFAPTEKGKCLCEFDLGILAKSAEEVWSRSRIIEASPGGNRKGGAS